jgi:hypothetical protein
LADIEAIPASSTTVGTAGRRPRQIHVQAMAAHVDQLTGWREPAAVAAGGELLPARAGRCDATSPAATTPMV